MSNRPRRMRVVPQDEEPGLLFEDLFADSLTFTMTVKGKPLEVSWAPASYTPDVEEAIAPLMGRAEDEDEDPEDETELTEDERAERETARMQAANHRRDIQNAAIRTFLVRVLTSWSLKRADGSPIAIDEPTLKTLPPAFLEQVMERMMENAGPKAVTEPPSGNS